MIRVESLGSVWLIDEDRQQYMRMPKTEGPRPDPDFALELADLVWLPYIEWELGRRDVWRRARRLWAGHDHVSIPDERVELDWLQILTPTAGWIYAPIAVVGQPR